jgi:hypothetical protein
MLLPLLLLLCYCRPLARLALFVLCTPRHRQSRQMSDNVRGKAGRIHTATGYHIAGGLAGLSLPKAFERKRVEKMKRMIVLGAWP